MNKLNPKQSLFCLEYLKDLNATRAAIDAGYSKKSAQQISSEILLKPVVQKELQRLFILRQKKIETSADQVLDDINTIKMRCMQELFPKMEKDTDGSWIETGEFTFDSKAALKACELLGKHLGMFVDKKEIDLKFPDSIKVEFIKP